MVSTLMGASGRILTLRDPGKKGQRKGLTRIPRPENRKGDSNSRTRKKFLIKTETLNTRPRDPRQQAHCPSRHRFPMRQPNGSRGESGLHLPRRVSSKEAHLEVSTRKRGSQILDPSL